MIFICEMPPPPGEECAIMSPMFVLVIFKNIKYSPYAIDKVCLIFFRCDTQGNRERDGQR